MFYKRPSLRMGGMPTGIDSLTPRVQAQEGFLGNRDMFFLPSNLKNLQNQRFSVGTSGGVIPSSARKMKSFPMDASAMGVASVAKTRPISNTQKLNQEMNEMIEIGGYGEIPKGPETDLTKLSDTMLKIMGTEETRAELKKRKDAEKTKIDMDEVSDNIIKDNKAKKDFQQKVLEGEKEFLERKDLNEQNKKELSFDEVVKSEDTFGNEFEKQYKRLQKYIGKDDTSKGELAIALSDAIGTPGTLADKAASLNSFLLSKVRAKRTDKKELAKLAFAAATDLEKARTVAGKQTFEEKRFNKLFKAADVINNKSKYSKEAVSAAQDYLKTTRDIQDLLKDKKGDFTLTGATVAKTISELPKTKRKLAKERAKGDKARPEKIAEYEQEIALAEAFLSKDLAAIQRLLKSDGGRVNLAESFPGTVGEAAEVQKAPAAQVDRLDYNALRTRLPREITDDIVRLLVNDDQALQDFSYIRTQGDVNSFNLKYGVTLVLPPESA
tara:strand:- start:5080 stop:6567 length:1488 start_codon:yes stop_codon:yes gene_type:complete